MTRRQTPPPQRPREDARARAELRAREQREREQRRSGSSTSSTRTRRERVTGGRRPSTEPGAAVARRERHEGLVAWLTRMVLAIPTASLNFVIGVLREVRSILGGVVRPFTKLVPSRSTSGSTSPRRTVSLPKRATRFGGAVDGRPAGAREERAADPVLSEAGRRAAARRRQLVRRRLRVLAVIVGVCSVAVAVVTLPRSSLFLIRHVEVTGAGSVGDLEVRRAVDDLLAGSTVYTLNEQAVERELEEFPFVREAHVERHLPGGIELRIVEYRPLALGTSDNRRFWLVARDGRVLARAQRDAWDKRVPIVQLTERRVRAGEMVGREPALRLLGSRAADSTLAFATVKVEEGRLVGTLDDDVEVRFGRATNLRAKVLVAERARQEAVRLGLDLLYIDVTVPGRFAWCRAKVSACHQPRGPEEDPLETSAAAPVATRAGTPAATPTAEPAAAAAVAEAP